MKPLHQGISVPDMDASVQWYQRIFGCAVKSDEVVPFLNARIVFLTLEDFELELFQYLGQDKKPLPRERMEPNEDIKTCGTKHVAYAVDDINLMMEKLKQEQADIVKPPFPMSGDLVSFIRDNSGILIELIQIGGGA
jgi:methylmalonyl-CoA/ethylmalonyl-CoA epimerase